jgi:hypothetical protein
VLRTYIGKYILPKEKFEEWKLAARLDSVLAVLKNIDKEKLPGLTLVEMKNGTVTLSEFLNWYWVRDQYIKLNEKNFRTYSISLEQMIWRMVRDKLLVTEADRRNLSERPSVKEQEKWWKDKIVYGYVRNEFANSVMLENKELKQPNDDSKQNSDVEKLSAELSKKIFRKVNQLKQKESIRINNEVLNSINVTYENDPTAIEVYTVKKEGLIPRTPYPSIDIDWKSWE